MLGALAPWALSSAMAAGCCCAAGGGRVCCRRERGGRAAVSPGGAVCAQSEGLSCLPAAQPCTRVRRKTAGEPSRQAVALHVQCSAALAPGRRRRREHIWRLASQQASGLQGTAARPALQVKLRAYTPLHLARERCQEEGRGGEERKSVPQVQGLSPGWIGKQVGKHGSAACFRGRYIGTTCTPSQGGTLGTLSAQRLTLSRCPPTQCAPGPSLHAIPKRPKRGVRPFALHTAFPSLPSAGLPRLPSSAGLTGTAHPVQMARSLFLLAIFGLCGLAAAQQRECQKRRHGAAAAS